MANNITPIPAGAAASSDNGPGAETAGRTVIADGVVAKIAGISVREVDGVFAVGGGAARAVGAIRDAIGTADLSQGVSVEVGDKQVAVDVTLVADYPYPLQEVADGVRSAVAHSIEDLVGMEIAEVNITINDVHVPTDEQGDSEPGVRAQ